MVTGIAAAARATRRAPPRNPRLPAALNAALGFFAGYGFAIPLLSLTDPANRAFPPPPEAWRAWAPAAAGIALGAVLALRALGR